MKKLLLFCLLGVLFITVDLVAVNSSPIHPTKDNLSKKEQKQQQRLQKKKAKWTKE